MMRFRPLWPVLIGVFLSVASVCTDNVAVAFVDVKFDDKAAIWSLLLDRRYDRVIAVTSGINEHGQAAQELHQYLERQNAMASIKFNPNKIEVLRGTNALQESAPHEKWWQGNPSLATDAADYGKLQRALHGSRVRVFQLAPTTPDQVRTLIDAADAGSIDSYMLLHGYNSRQINMEWQTYFLRNLRSWLVARDPHADVYFTTSFDSYAAKNGGKQLISDIHGMFPEKDLKQALQDPFWSRQLLKAHQEGLTSTPFPQQDVKKLDDLIYQARTQPEKYKAWRDYISHYIQNEVLAHHPETSGESRVLGRLRYTLLPEFGDHRRWSSQMQPTLQRFTAIWTGLREDKARECRWNLLSIQKVRTGRTPKLASSRRGTTNCMAGC